MARGESDVPALWQCPLRISTVLDQISIVVVRIETELWYFAFCSLTLVGANRGLLDRSPVST